MRIFARSSALLMPRSPKSLMRQKPLFSATRLVQPHQTPTRPRELIPRHMQTGGATRLDGGCLCGGGGGGSGVVGGGDADAEGVCLVVGGGCVLVVALVIGVQVLPGLSQLCHW